jgi:2-hydroxychromene-2-carboxylate isomerase
MLFAACEDGRGVQFAEGLLRPIWEEGLDVASPDAIGAAITAAGFDAADLFARAQTDAVKQGLVAATDAIVARGAFGIPTMWVGPEGEGEMFFGKERLGQIEDLLAKG